MLRKGKLFFFVKEHTALSVPHWGRNQLHDVFHIGKGYIIQTCPQEYQVINNQSSFKIMNKNLPTIVRTIKRQIHFE